MKKIHYHKIQIFRFTGIYLLLGILFSSCSSKETSEAVKTMVESSMKDQDKIIITRNQFKSGKMELGKITMREFNTVVKASGMFAVPPQNKANVSAYFAGYVKEIGLLPGDAVKKGQILFTIENPEYIQLQQDFLEARGQLNYLKSDYERQKELMADNVTSKKSYLKAESEYKVILARYQSLKKKLSLMNINSNTLSGENIRSVIGIRSPLSGYVTAVNTGKGMYLNPSDIAVTVTNTDDLHVELKVFEKDLPLVKMGQQINIRLQNNTDNVFRGKVHLINRAINEKERTVEIHGDLINEDEAKLFAPGMYVEGEILTTISRYPALPSEAISNIDNEFFALVRNSDTSFTRVLVNVGMVNKKYTQILNFHNFDQSTEFLTKGAFDLIVE